jgi:hypothetical protein
MRRRYEINDEEWIVIEPFLPPTVKPQGGRPPKDRCQMLNASFGSYFDRTRLEPGHDRDDRSPCQPAWIGRNIIMMKRSVP